MIQRVQSLCDKPFEQGTLGGVLRAEDPSTRVHVWDVVSQEILRTIDDPAETVAFTADGTELVTAGTDGARVWNVRSWERTAAFEGHAGQVFKAAFAPDGATAGTDGTLRLWDLTTVGSG